MGAKCETVGKYVLPVFRSLVAKELVNSHNLTQIEAAQKLGTTQAAISQYLNSKRAIVGAKQFGDALPRIKSLAEKTAQRLAKGGVTWNQVVLDFCLLCSTLSDIEIDQTGDNYVI